MLCILLSLLFTMIAHICQRNKCINSSSDLEENKDVKYGQPSHISNNCCQVQGAYRINNMWYQYSKTFNPSFKNSRLLNSSVYNFQRLPYIGNPISKTKSEHTFESLCDDSIEPVYQEIGDVLKVNPCNKQNKKNWKKMKTMSTDNAFSYDMKNEDVGSDKKNKIVYGVISAKEVAKFIPCQPTAIVRKDDR